MLKDKKLICIIGRTGSGKDTVREYMERKKGLKSVVSYTTRPKRANETDGVEHHFISKEEFDDIMKIKEIAAYTKIEDPDTGTEGYEYCATIQGVLASDIYEIDPIGLEKLKEQLKYENITIVEVYIHCPEDIRLNRVKVGRGEEEIEKFNIRNANEDQQFRSYEIAHADDPRLNRNIGDTNFFWIENDSSLKELFCKVDETLLKILYL
jgi:guanylate kinase